MESKLLYYNNLRSDRGGARGEGGLRRLHTEQRRALRSSTHDLRIKSLEKPEDHRDLSDSKSRQEAAFQPVEDFDGPDRNK